MRTCSGKPDPQGNAQTLNLKQPEKDKNNKIMKRNRRFKTAIQQSLIAGWLFFFSVCFYTANAQSWSEIGAGISGTSPTLGVYATAVFNSELVAAGDFQYAGGTAVNNIAKWNGSAWLPMGTGLNGRVEALAVYKNKLFAGGSFLFAGATEVNFIAQWNGVKWRPVSSGMKSTVKALLVYNNELIAGGYFSAANGSKFNYISKWNGNKRAAMGTGFNSQVMALGLHGTDLYAGGFFTIAGGLSSNHIAKWNGTTWLPVGTGSENGVSNIVYSLASYNGELIVGGLFYSAGTTAVNNIAKWNGTAWLPLSTGMYSAAYGGYVLSLSVFNAQLIAGGHFSIAGGTYVNNIASWNGSTWSAMNGGIGNGGFSSEWAYTITPFNGKLVTGGIFISPGRYITQWSPAGIVAVQTNALNIQQPALALKVYPTLVSSFITIQAAEAVNNAIISVADISGRKLMSKKASWINSYPFDISGLAKGLYIISVSTPAETVSFKIYKE